jgi:hypothetical protein
MLNGTPDRLWPNVVRSVSIFNGILKFHATELAVLLDRYCFPLQRQCNVRREREKKREREREREIERERE